MSNVHHLPENPALVEGIRLDDPNITEDDLARVVAALTKE
jgi:hypothetical protein